MREIEHRYTILCESVRREDNGKLLIIGMFLDVVKVSKTPFQLNFQACMIFEQKTKQDHNLKLQISFGKNQVLNGEVDINKGVKGQSTLVVPPFIVKGENEGVLVIKGKIDNEKRWKTLGKHRIICDPTISPTF